MLGYASRTYGAGAGATFGATFGAMVPPLVPRILSDLEWSEVGTIETKVLEDLQGFPKP